MWGWVCLRSMLETHPGWITPVKEASPIPHRQGVLIFVAWDGSTPSPGAFPSPCKRGGATASSPMSFQMSGPLSVTLRHYIKTMACSLWVLLLASCFSSGQQLCSVIRLQPFSQSRRDTFGLCKLYANERAAACCETPTALWDQAALTTSLMLSRQHRLIHMHQVESSLSVGVFVLFMVWLHHHEQQQLVPLSLMQSELKSCYYLDFRSFIFFVKHENRQSVQTRALR